MHTFSCVRLRVRVRVRVCVCEYVYVYVSMCMCILIVYTCPGGWCCVRAWNISDRNCNRNSGGSFKISNSREEAVQGADTVYCYHIFYYCYHTSHYCYHIFYCCYRTCVLPSHLITANSRCRHCLLRFTDVALGVREVLYE